MRGNRSLSTHTKSEKDKVVIWDSSEMGLSVRNTKTWPRGGPRGPPLPNLSLRKALKVLSADWDVTLDIAVSQMHLMLGLQHVVKGLYG